MNNNDTKFSPGPKPGAFDIPRVEFPNEEQLIQRLMELRDTSSDSGAGQFGEVQSELLDRALAVVATNAWKARAKMVDEAGEPREEMKRIFRHVEAMLVALMEVGLKIKDHIGEAFDYGMPLRVITTQPTAGLARETVIETIKPTIYWRQRIIQTGEVVIATPA
jgi:hypothetical protein